MFVENSIFWGILKKEIPSVAREIALEMMKLKSFTQFYMKISGMNYDFIVKVYRIRFFNQKNMKVNISKCFDRQRQHSIVNLTNFFCFENNTKFLALAKFYQRKSSKTVRFSWNILSVVFFSFISILLSNQVVVHRWNVLVFFSNRFVTLHSKFWIYSILFWNENSKYFK